MLERNPARVVEPVNGEDEADDGDLVEVLDRFDRVPVSGRLAASDRLTSTDDLGPKFVALGAFVIKRGQAHEKLIDSVKWVNLNGLRHT